MGSRPIHVLIVDDHPMVRLGLSRVLELCDELEVVGAAASGEEALELCTSAAPDVVLIDLKLPDIDGIEAIRILKQRHPDVQVVVLSNYPEGQMIMAATQAGARGYLLKTIEGWELRQAIGAVAAGRTFLMLEAAEPARDEPRRAWM